MSWSETRIELSRRVQAVAKDVLARLSDHVGPQDCERTLAEKAVALLSERGVNQTWYHACPALVLLGSRSCLSISGRDYVPGKERVGRHNLITVDLSPLQDGVCGDCARSFLVEDGAVTPAPRDPALAAGGPFLAGLHAEMSQFVQPATTLHELFVFAERRLQDAGFENLDFLGNVGHSLPPPGEKRVFIERGNLSTLGEVGLFTFEPHVRQTGGRWGFKHEDLYFLNDEGRAEVL